MTPSSGEKVRYAGEMQDSSSGLYYIFARYMDPELGRFVSLDPELGSLSMPQTMNRYVYCVNNPLRFTDPTGMWLESLFDIGCIIYDIHELWKNPTWGNAGWLLLDIGCLILPGVPALSPALKATKWFDRANDARKIADKGEDLSDVVRYADDMPTLRNPTKSIQGQDFYRYMTKGEYQKMLGTKTDGKYLLKTLSPRGETFFTPNKYSSFMDVGSHLGVGQPKSLSVHFRVVNDPVLSKAGIARYYDGTPIPGGGIELASKGDTWVELLDVSRLLKWPARGI